MVAMEIRKVGKYMPLFNNTVATDIETIRINAALPVLRNPKLHMYSARDYVITLPYIPISAHYNILQCHDLELRLGRNRGLS